MKNKIIGLFIMLIFSLSPMWERAGVRGAHAQIGGETYQRVKASTAPETAKPAGQQEKDRKPEKKKKHAEKEGGEILAIGEDEELTFPAGMKECRVYDSKSLEKAVLQATWKGECEWIVLRASSDWNPTGSYWLQMDKPLVLENKHPLARGHPLVITNDTGRGIVFRTPRNGGCAVIMRKPDIAILGFTFEGAICR